MNYKKIATGISWVLHPFLLPVYLMAVLLTMTAFSHYPPNVKFYLLWVVALYAIIIPLLIPLALRGVAYKPIGASALLRRNLFIYGLGGVIVPFVGIKLIDMLVSVFF